MFIEENDMTWMRQEIVLVSKLGTIVIMPLVPSSFIKGLKRRRYFFNIKMSTQIITRMKRVQNLQSTGMKCKRNEIFFFGMILLLTSSMQGKREAEAMG